MDGWIGRWVEWMNALQNAMSMYSGINFRVNKQIHLGKICSLFTPKSMIQELGELC